MKLNLDQKALREYLEIKKVIDEVRKLQSLDTHSKLILNLDQMKRNIRRSIVAVEQDGQFFSRNLY
ncbi:Uncharacterised protein [uncultured archaeon]|nr:Uncharacterised protein [uncultured archaeon]